MINFPVSLTDILTNGYIKRDVRLTGWWNFDDQDGRDSSGNGDTAMFVGTSVSALGVSGYGRSFTGASDYMEI